MRGSRNCRPGGGGGWGVEQRGKVDIPQQRGKSGTKSSVNPEGGGGQGVRPHGKSQVIWGSIGNKQLDPSLEKVGPPPSPGKSWTPSGTLKIDSFL